MMDVQAARMTTWVLAGICGLLVVTALIQLAGYGRGYGWSPAEDSTDEPMGGAIDRQPFNLPSASRFSAVSERPLFNDDRKPTPVADVEAIVEGPPPVPLNVTLTGVILVRKTETTEELRIAMVHDNARNESMALKVGMPLGGEQGGWTLSSVEPRMAVFKNANDETAEVELQTAAVATQAPGARRPPPQALAAPGAVAPDRSTNAADSDLAKRIEERRRQMREEAERLRAERGGSNPNEQKK